MQEGLRMTLNAGKATLFAIFVTVVLFSSLLPGVGTATPTPTEPPNNTTDGYAPTGWSPPPRPVGAGVSQLEYLTMWAGAAGKPWAVEFNPENESQAYYYARTVNEPYTYWNYTDTARNWNQQALRTWDGGDVNTSKYPTSASLAEGEYIKDAHLTAPIVSQRIIVHKEQATTQYITTNGRVGGVMDYRVETPEDETTQVWGFFVLERRTTWTVKQDTITNCNFEIAGATTSASPASCSQDAISATFNNLKPGDEYVLSLSATVEATVEKRTQEHVCTERRKLPPTTTPTTTTTTTASTTTTTTTTDGNRPPRDPSGGNGFIQTLLSVVFTPEANPPNPGEGGDERYGECIESEWQTTHTQEYTERVPISDVIPVTVMDQEATFHYRQNEHTGEAYLEAELPAFYTRVDLFDNVTLRGPWKRFTARDPSWDEVRTSTSNTTTSVYEPFTPVQTHAYPFQSNFGVTTEGDAYVFETRGKLNVVDADSLGPATLPNHITLTPPETVTVPRRLQVRLPGTTEPILNTKQEFQEGRPRIQQAWTTIDADWKETGALIQTNLTAHATIDEGTITISLHLTEEHAGDPIDTGSLPNTAIELSLLNATRTVNTNAAGNTTLTVPLNDAGYAVRASVVTNAPFHTDGPLYTTDSTQISKGEIGLYLQRFGKSVFEYLLDLALVVTFLLLIPLWLFGKSIGWNINPFKRS